MALRHAARSVGVPALHRTSVPRVSPSAGPRPLAYHSRPLGRRLARMILASRKLEYHMEKELGRLFREERENTEMYGQKELEEILATIKALSEPTRVCRTCMKSGETQVTVLHGVWCCCLRPHSVG